MKLKVSLKELISVINNKITTLDNIIEEKYQHALKGYEPYKKFNELDLQKACIDFIVTEDVQHYVRKGLFLRKEYYTENVERLDVVAFEKWLYDECGVQIEQSFEHFYVNTGVYKSACKSVVVGNYRYDFRPYIYDSIYEPTKEYYYQNRSDYKRAISAKEEITDMISKFGEDRTIELTREDLIRLGISENS